MAESSGAGIRLAALSPHPPIAIPEVGGVGREPASRTVAGLEALALRVKEVEPEVLVMITPHGRVDPEAIGILHAPSLKGDFSLFGRSDVSFEWPAHLELAKLLQSRASSGGKKMVRLRGSHAELDHGLMVPLYFLGKAGVNAPLLALTMSFGPPGEQFDFGRLLGTVCREAGLRAALIASGDLSHRLTRDAPAGYDPKGREFDEAIVSALSRADAAAVLGLDPGLVLRAGECGLRPIAMMLGALEGLQVRPEVLSYEGPFGVGYAVATFEVLGEGSCRRVDAGRSLVSLARSALEAFVRSGQVIEAPADLPPELKKRAGAFVTIKKRGELRGCIGTICPTRETLAEEVISNAIESGTRDPRFPPVSASELSEITVSVDVLSAPEAVKDLSDLDPKTYGVIVEKGRRRGLLLPDLEGIDTVDRQIEIARRKADIGPREAGVKLYRFEVTRHEEGDS